MLRLAASLVAVAFAACGGNGTSNIDAGATIDARPGGGPDARAAADARPADARPADARPPDAEVAVCGDGHLDPGEQCDTGIASGPGACPTVCDDGDPCTTDALASGGTCQAHCTATPILDCPPAGEATAFRVTQLALRDPHAFLSGCTDLTDGLLSVNGQIASALSGDTNHDGNLDLNVVIVMEPLAQGGQASTPGEVVFADCPTPAATTSCTPGNGPRYAATMHNMTDGSCLGILPGTASAGTLYTNNYPPITETVAAGADVCFASDPQTLTVTFAGISLTLQEAQVAAVYSGAPATGLMTGLLRGFISEADAEATIVPLPIIGNKKLAQLLWGGQDNDCDDPDFPSGDRDVGPDGFTSGYYFYLDFTATQRPWN